MNITFYYHTYQKWKNDIIFLMNFHATFWSVIKFVCASANKNVFIDKEKVQALNWLFAT